MIIYSIIVIYNGMQRNWIQKCFDSLLSSSIATEIIAIDNGSTDGSIEFIQKSYPQIKLIVANENLGFAKANNIGIKYALEKDADYFFLLNQDAWVEKNTIDRLVEAFKQLPKAGIVSPIHLNGDKTNLDCGFVNYVVNNNTPNFISDLYLNRLRQFYGTQFVNAAAWLVSRECIEKVGGFDTSVFYHYGEDDNFCQRVIYHGFNIYIATATTICHDREERKGKRPEEHEKCRKDVEKCVYYGNILEDDKILEYALSASKRKFYVQLIKRTIKLQFKELNIQRKIAQENLNLYFKIKQSRKKNKQGGLVWLNG